jgi:hypothetical protein
MKILRNAALSIAGFWLAFGSQPTSAALIEKVEKVRASEDFEAFLTNHGTTEVQDLYRSSNARNRKLAQWINWPNWGNWNNWNNWENFSRLPQWGNGWNNFLN